MKAPILPDVLKPGLALVFCGTAAGRMSAERGHYYAHPQNKFWRVLHEVGLTPERLDPAHYARVLEFGIGLTDIAKNDSGMDSQLQRGSLDAEAVAALRARIAKFAPRHLAFTSLTGGRRVAGAKARFGPQDAMLGETKLWILPSPSPAANWNWDAAPWRALTRAVRREIPHED